MGVDTHKLGVAVADMMEAIERASNGPMFTEDAQIVEWAFLIRLSDKPYPTPDADPNVWITDFSERSKAKQIQLLNQGINLVAIQIGTEEGIEEHEEGRGD